MTGSMYAAVSGLKAHMSALNVIGNNVSNVNTFGYKTTRYTFNEALYTTQRTGSDGTDTLGGRNPAQVGFGASIGTIDLDMSTKNYSPTSNALDTMIDGDGFFMVGDKVVGADDSSKINLEDTTTLKGMNLTRLGNFNIDPNGYLVDGNGSVVWGFLSSAAASAYNPETGAAIQTSSDNNNQNQQQSDGLVNLKEMTAGDVDALNQKRKANNLPELINIEYTEKLNDQNQIERNAKGEPIMVVKSASVASTMLGAIRIPVLKTTVKGTYNTETNEFTETVPRQVTTSIVWPNSDTLADGVSPNTKRYINSNGTNGETEVDAPANGVTGMVTYERMESDSTSIDEKTGALRIMTSDGSLLTVGYLAIAKVTNPNGVTHVDGRYYQAQDGAGTMRVTSIGGAVAGTETAGDTALLTGGLESSGTDLATEITNMITVQRGYQANTRIVTVTDSMLEELVNMKR